MSAQTLTIISGVALVVVFALAGWSLRRNRTRDEQGRSNKSLGNDR